MKTSYNKCYSGVTDKALIMIKKIITNVKNIQENKYQFEDVSTYRGSGKLCRQGDSITRLLRNEIEKILYTAKASLEWTRPRANRLAGGRDKQWGNKTE